MLLRRRPGFLLMDVLMGIAVLALFMLAVGSSLITSQEGVARSGERARATYLTEQAMEGVRAVRDRNFADLTVGVHGLTVGSGGLWVFQGTGVTTPDAFRTTVRVSSVASDWVHVTASTHWDHGRARTGTVSLVSDLTNWRAVQSIGNWALPTVQGNYTDSGTPLFNYVVTTGNYAFVSSEVSGGGRGLYVFNITSLSSPSYVATGFNLNYAGYSMLVVGTKLYILTGDANGELKIYDISDPENFSSSQLLSTVDIPGAAKARSLALYGSTIFIGSTEDATVDEFHAYGITETGSIVLEDGMEESGGFTDISLKDGYAYVSGTRNSLELRVIDVFDSQDVQSAPGSGMNLTDVQDALTIATFGTSALIGRANGSVIEELVLLPLGASPVPSTPPGPWYREVGGSANAIDVEPGGRVAFVASDFSSKELQIVDIGRFKANQNPEIGYIDTTTGAGRGVGYDTQRDRVYLLTNKAFIIIRPGT